jgi:hypothetical protein
MPEMDFMLFQENRPFILESYCQGDFDYIDSAGEVFETDFFRFIKAKEILRELSESYPTPRKKEDVPLWFYVASNLSMRLHGVHSFNAFPLLVRCGGMLNAFGPKAGRKVTHPDTGDVTITCEGFNKKNHYDREAPCDQDFLRKMSKDTDAEALMRWFCDDVVRVFRRRRAFDKEGIFIGDASYLFVPDNPNYEGSVKLLFDDNDHPITGQEYKEMTDEQKIRCRRRRCYKMVTLLHTNPTLDFFLFVAVKVVSGKDHESPVLYELVKEFVEVVGKGVMKRLILDRGFLDGKAISICKKDYGIDILIPVRRNMDIYHDAMALFRQSEVDWVYCEKPLPKVKKPPRPRPEVIVKREKKRRKKIQQLKEKKPPPLPEKTVVKREAAVIGGFSSWSSCTVPLSVVANREHYADGHDETWLLLDTRSVQDPTIGRLDYHLRISTEERYRQFKCFIDLTHFTSCAFSMVVNQVVFIMLTYNLLQLYLFKQGRPELNKKTLPRVRQQLLPSDNHVIIYYQNYYALFNPMELVEISVNLDEEARKKIADKCRRLRLELNGVMSNPRPP